MPPKGPFFPITDQASFSNAQAASLNNAAQTLEANGDLAGAELKHLEALRMKIAASGEKSIHVGLTKNALGELYLQMNKLDEAKVMLEEADVIRAVTGPKFDEACTKDNLGRMWEMMGDIKSAKLWREKLKPDNMICSRFQCPKSTFGTFSKRSELSKCSKCSCVFYCGRECQRKDWGRHKNFCKKVEEEDVAGTGSSTISSA